MVSIGKLMSRLSEFQKSEESFVANMKLLQESFSSLQQDSKWCLSPQQIAVMLKSMKILNNETCENPFVSLHSKLAHSLRKIEYAAGQDSLRAIRGLRDIFQTCLHPDQDMGQQFVQTHAEFEVLSAQIIYHLHKKAGGQVKGDRAVGTLIKAEGSLAASLAELQSLLVLPSQSVVRFGIFLEEMAREVRSQCGEASQDSADLLLPLEVRPSIDIVAHLRPLSYS